MPETWFWSLSWEDSLEKGKATHSSILAWRIPWFAQSMGLPKSQTWLSDFHFHIDPGILLGPLLWWNLCVTLIRLWSLLVWPKLLLILLWRYFVYLIINRIYEKKLYLKVATKILSEVTDCWPAQKISDQNCNINSYLNFQPAPGCPMDLELTKCPNTMNQWLNINLLTCKHTHTHRHYCHIFLSTKPWLRHTAYIK